MKKWYKEDLVRNLVDMHIPNGEGNLENFDSVKYAENIKKSGAGTAYIYASNCLGLCFYPTEIGLRHKAAERDIFGETVKECRKRGLGVVGYLNSWGTFVCDAHPEWNVIYGSGKTLRSHSRYGNPCVLNDEYIEYFTSIVYEMCSKYDIDGLWVDMVGIWSPVCFCDACKSKYRQQKGKELPRTVNWNDPEFVEYFHFKGENVAAYAKKIRETALSAKPHISVSLQAAGIKYATTGIGINDDRYYSCSDYCSGDFYTDREGVNTVSRILYKLTENAPFEFMTSRCKRLEMHTMNKNINELVLQSYAAFMYNGAFLFIDAIDPDGGMDSSFYDKISVISKNFEPYLPYVDLEARPLRDVGVYFNFLASINSAENGKPVEEMEKSSQMFERLKRIAKAFAASRTDYDIITRKNLNELSNYKAMVFPSLELLSEEEARAVRKYVEDGGNAYVSGFTSLRDYNGNLKDNFMLSDVLGVRYEGRFELKPAYLSPTKENGKIFGRYTKKYPHSLKGDIIKVKAVSDGETLATVTLPLSDASDIINFSSAISNPPSVYTDYPAIFLNKYGKGKVIYSAGVIEDEILDDNLALFAALVNELAGEKTVNLEGSSCVDFTAYINDKCLKLVLLNHQESGTPIKIDKLSVKINISNMKKIKKIYAVRGDAVTWKKEEDILTIETSLDIFKMIIAEFE